MRTHASLQPLGRFTIESPCQRRSGNVSTYPYKINSGEWIIKKHTQAIVSSGCKWQNLICCSFVTTGCQMVQSRWLPQWIQYARRNSGWRTQWLKSTQHHPDSGSSMSAGGKTPADVRNGSSPVRQARGPGGRGGGCIAEEPYRDKKRTPRERATRRVRGRTALVVAELSRHILGLVKKKSRHVPG